MLKTLRILKLSETSNPDWFKKITKYDYVVECDNETGRFPLYTVEELKEMDWENPFYCGSCGVARTSISGSMCEKCKQNLADAAAAWASAKCNICGVQASYAHGGGYRCEEHYWTGMVFPTFPLS